METAISRPRSPKLPGAKAEVQSLDPEVSVGSAVKRSLLGAGYGFQKFAQMEAFIGESFMFHMS